MPTIKSAPLTEYSGIVLNQNQIHDDDVHRRAVSDSWIFQEFNLPDDYPRGSNNDQRLPSLSGIQVLVDIESGYASSAALDYFLQYQSQESSEWVDLFHSADSPGVAIGAPYDGNNVWFNIPFNEIIQITEPLYETPLRFAIRGRSATGPVNEVVPYEDRQVTINMTPYTVTLEPDQPYALEVAGIDSVLLYDSVDRKTYYSVQQGISHVRYTAPTPLVDQEAYLNDGVSPIIYNGQNVALNFRVLALVADEGEDFLGNKYRGVVTELTPTNVELDQLNKFWLSKPNPSRFAVERLYFDLTDSNDDPRVVDRVLLDPITPNMYFHIYYTNEGVAGTDATSWDDRIWTHVPKTFRAQKRETHALPEPILAKYIKIEFSHLQPRPFDPGDFQTPVTYQKHPKWVLDYFLIRAEADEYSPGDQFIPRRVSVTYNAYDLAYNYYLDDLAQEPEMPVSINTDFEGTVNEFLEDRSDVSDVIAQEMANKISIAFRPYVMHPALRGKYDYLLSSILRGFDTDPALVPVEEFSVTAKPGSDLSGLRKDAIVYERTHPVMWFYLDCRHKYREVRAPFTHDRAYFAGVYEVMFSREQYSVASDTTQYIAAVGDDTNIQQNDFESDESGTLVVESDN